MPVFKEELYARKVRGLVYAATVVIVIGAVALLNPEREIEAKDLPGDYVANFADSARLTIQPDGTYWNEHAGPSGKRMVNRNQWHLRDKMLTFWDYILPEERQTKGSWVVHPTWSNGKIKLSVNADLNLYYIKQ